MPLARNLVGIFARTVACHELSCTDKIVRERSIESALDPNYFIFCANRRENCGHLALERSQPMEISSDYSNIDLRLAFQAIGVIFVYLQMLTVGSRPSVYTNSTTLTAGVEGLEPRIPVPKTGALPTWSGSIAQNK